MPCYEVNLVSVKFSGKHRDILERALDALGYTYWKRHSSKNVIEEFNFRIRLDKGIAELDSNPNTQLKLNQLSREYSRQAVAEVAKRKKWAFRMSEKKRITLKRY